MLAERTTSEVTGQIPRPSRGLWSFLFGAIYYAAKGMRGSSVLSSFTLNGLFMILPIMNKSLVGKWISVRSRMTPKILAGT